MDSKSNGVWTIFWELKTIVKDKCYELFLKFGSEKKLKIINSIFHTKRIHCDTWLHQPTGLVKRLDYIVTSTFVSQLHRNRSENIFSFDTDHYMVKMTLHYPTTHKKLFRPISNIRYKLNQMCHFFIKIMRSLSFFLNISIKNWILIISRLIWIICANIYALPLMIPWMLDVLKLSNPSLHQLGKILNCTI